MMIFIFNDELIQLFTKFSTTGANRLPDDIFETKKKSIFGGYDYLK